MRKTLKKGGLLKTNSVSKIKSIGFEFETSWFVKLSQYKDVLFNSGSNSESISAINKMFEGEIEQHEAAELLYNIEYQQEEYLEEEIDENKNTVFQITNDFSNGQAIRKLKKICDATLDSKEIYQFHMSNQSQSSSPSQQMVYPIQLIQSEANTNCYEFSFVEWLYTKYAPKQSSNLIINSFMEMMQYLINHLDSLVPMEGELKMKICNKKKTKCNYITIDEPQKRLLYHKPQTNLYYLQLHSDDKKKTIDDICGKAQMTFGCNIKDALSIMKNISNGKLKEQIINIEKVAAKIMHNAGIKSKKAINYLALILYRIFFYLEYRKAQTKYLKNVMAFNCRHSNYILFDELLNAVSDDSDIISERTEGSTARETKVSLGENATREQSSLGRIFDSTAREQSSLGENATRETKVSLDSRNIGEYSERTLPSVEGNHMSSQREDWKVASESESKKSSAKGLVDIIMQPDVLAEIFDERITTKIIDQTNDHYGNPGYSLQSYFEYILSEEEDWLLHVDSTTKRQLVNNNIVLIEFRLFQHYLTNHFETYYPMVVRKSGSCGDHSDMYSIGQYRELLKLYNEKSKSLRKTRKNALPPPPPKNALPPPPPKNAWT